jgi:hypothetical protein
MKVGRRVGVVVATVTVVMLAAPSAAHAAAITVPSSVNLGSFPSGTTSFSRQLGTITVTDSGLVAPSFTATVTGTVFTTGAGAASQTIPKTSIRYWSGPATTVSGLLCSGTPGQATAADAQDLSVSRTAFSGTGLLLSISATWNPTIIVNIPAAAVAGSYSGTITHSVA